MSNAAIPSPFRSRSPTAHRHAWLALVTVVSLASCASTHRDGTDREAFFADVRVRKEFEGEPDHEDAHFEAGWSLTDGDDDDLDFAIHDMTVGIGSDRRIGEDGWAGFVGGLAWQHLELDVEGTDFDGADSVGPYLALQGGWRVMTWLEPFARADVDLYLPDFGSTLGFEVGARIHVDPAALFLGWRYAHYELNDVNEYAGVDEVELDVSGFVAGLEFAF